MTTQQLITTAIDQLPAILGTGAGVWFLTEAAKRIKAIPVFKGQTVRLRALAAVLAALSMMALGLADGTLSGDNLKEVITSVLGLVVSAGGSWAVAHGVHVIAKPEPEEGEEK